MSNVVLVTIDSLRADHLGGFGYDRDTSPVVDELVSRGLSFTGFANSHWTRASFPSIITSTYPLEYGGFEYLADERTTVGTATSELGYETAAFHSNLWLSRDYNYDRGFGRFYDSKSDPSALARLRTWLKLNLDHDGLVYRTLQRLYDATEEKAGVDVGQTYKDAEVITDEAIDWLSTAEEPFFCWVHYMDVHHPYVPHDGVLDELGLTVSVTEREAVRLRRKMLEEPDSLTDDEFRTLVDLYDGEIRYTDAQIGRLLDEIDKRFGPGETNVVVTSDHGEEFGEHGVFSHSPTFYDPVLAVPIVVSGPDVPDDGHQDELVELLDVAPTCVDLAGGEIPSEYRGRSVLDAAGSGEDARVISETWQGDDYKLAIRTREWKYIWDRDAGETELYDLVTDPAETQDRSEEESDVAGSFRSELSAHIEELRETNRDLPEPEMDARTEERLQNLGYLE